MMMSMQGSNENDPLVPCCDQLNACYQICGSIELICEEKFFKCMDNVCANAGPQKATCDKDVSLKKLLAGMSGCGKYNQGQQAGCKCVKEKDMEQSRKEVLRNFYKSYNPDGVDDTKIDSLLAKVDSPGKFSNLLQKLVAKYPKSIKRVKAKDKDKGRQFMDDFMKNREKGHKPKEDTAEDEVDDGDEAVEDLLDEL